jgi:hypothetical protein
MQEEGFDAEGIDISLEQAAHVGMRGYGPPRSSHVLQV